MAESEAVAWNASFEAQNGLVVSAEGRAGFTGVLGARLCEHVPALRGGFAIRELEAVCDELVRLRDALMKQA